MAGRSFLSRLYALLVGVVFLCLSCLAPGGLPRPVSQSVVDNAPIRHPIIQTALAPAHSHYIKTIGLQGDMYGKLPLSFEANRGQTDPQVKFLSHGPGYALFLTANEAVLSLQKSAQREMPNEERKNAHLSFGPQAVVRMQVLDANPMPLIIGAEALPGKVNYLHGNDPALWRTDIPTYSKIQYQDVYPGIDLVYYGQQRQLEYDFIVAPGSTPSTIRLTFTNEVGQPLPQTLDTQGNLILHTPAGEVQLHKPFIYQENNGTRTEIAGSYARHGTTLGFQVASYDKSQPLVIDPKLIVYSTFLGGDRRDSAFALALDEDRNVYLAGQTLSANFPLTADAVDTTADVNNGDAFIAKLNDTGTEMLYSTYLGGPGADVAKAIAVDSDGNAYIAGETLAPDQLTPVFPTTPDAVQSTSGGGVSDAFVAKLNDTGTELLYSTYLGGEAYDRANAIAIDASGNAYIAGQTLSDFFFPDSENHTVFGDGPIAPNNTADLPHDAFVVKLDPTGTERSYTAVFSGRAYEEATAIAVNENGEAYVVGFTSSFNFPVTLNAFQPDLQLYR